MDLFDAAGWREFALSPGFGGLAAVIAASIAYAGVRRTTRHQREAARKQQWWERAHWALDLTLQDDLEARLVGLNVLDALAESGYAAEHEIELVLAATESALDRYEDQLAAGSVLIDDAHFDQDDMPGGQES